MKARALFLDRDGTLVYPVHFPSRPEELRLYEHMGPTLRALQARGFLIVIITNQSGLARGYFSEDDLTRMHEYLRAELLELGVTLSNIYYCPHHPEGSVAQWAVDCECRKPRPGLLLQASQELDIDLERSWFIGDILDDVEAGKRAGCRTILVDLGTESIPQCPERWPDFVARDTPHALRIAEAIEAPGTLEGMPIELEYRPSNWSKALELSTEKIAGATYD